MFGLPVDEKSDEVSEVCFIVLPIPTFREMTRAANSRGMTFAQFFRSAIEEYLEKTPMQKFDKERSEK